MVDRHRKDSEAMSRQVAILSGGDWYDASVEHLTIPDDMDLKDQKAAYDQWYRNEYCPSGTPGGPHALQLQYLTFVDWLRRSGATDGTVEEFSDMI
jgi:hypothetical protein